MSSPGARPSGSSPTAAGGKTWEQVIAIFRDDLRLRVTDDQAAIDQSIASQKDRYRRDSNSPDRRIAIRGQDWFRTTTEIADPQKRRQIADIVYQHFTHEADTSLSAAVDAGLTTMSAELQESLRKLAWDSCTLDDPLSEQFVQRYMQDRDLQPGEVVVNPAPLEFFEVESRLHEIYMTWEFPARSCDAIEIIREAADGSPEGAWPEGPRVFDRDTATSFTDGGVAAGAYYRYRAHSVFKKIRGVDSERRAVCLAEVRHADSHCEEGKVRLSYEAPANARVLVFRREGGPPEIRRGSGGPEAAHGATRLLHGASPQGLEDSDVTPGTTYQYLIVSDFGEGHFSPGVLQEIRVPVPPPSIPSLTARYVSHQGRDEVHLDWDPVGEGLQYAVVRRSGAVAPEQLKGLTPLYQGQQTQCLDEEVEPGLQYSYSVFAVSEGVHSHDAATASVAIMPDVMNQHAEAGDGTVELFWDPPRNVTRIEVRRSLDRMDAPHQGVPIKVLNLKGTRDTNLENGRRYWFRITCVYRPDGKTDAYSHGAEVPAVPDVLPEPVKTFMVKPQGLAIHMEHEVPAKGQALVLRCRKPPSLTFGERVKVSDLDGYGERSPSITAAGGGCLVDTDPDRTLPHYCLFVANASTAVYCTTACAVLCPDIDNLTPSVTADGVVLRWTWPPEGTTVLIARRADDWPEGADDPQATCTRLGLSGYRQAGDKYLDRLRADTGTFFYRVFAQAPGRSGSFLASALGDGCRAQVQWHPWMRLAYQLKPATDKARRGKELRLTWTVETPFPGFAGFLLLADQECVPESEASGLELFRWTPASGPAGEAWVSLAPVQTRGWARFFCKLVIIDPLQRASCLVTHPDVSVPFSREGEAQSSVTAKFPGGYKAGVPRTVVCPTCFEEFALDDMLYTVRGQADAQPQPARRTALQRLRNEPPPLPTDKRGNAMNLKLCPQGHELPGSAGTQPSLVIGLIGALRSGKSHYIASLIHRLQQVVGNDMNFACTEVTDDTLRRYKDEFYRPLFQDNMSLPATVGQPPPLIYDLRITRNDCGERFRGVTLSLYDTSGENFNDPEVARKTVQYLRVASGAIFLVDPLQVPSVRGQVSDDVPLPPLDEEASPGGILANVLNLLQQNQVLRANAPFTIPVAVVLTKCDVLRDEGIVPPTRLWTTEHRHIGEYSGQAHDDMCGMWAEYVQRWEGNAYALVKNRFLRHAFFGVSATGCAPDKDTTRYKYISPWRVEDPLLWLLAELDVIPYRRA